MNIKHFLSASAAIMALAACSDYDPGVASQAVDLTEEEEAFIKNEYAVSFTDRMGTIDENHTWGFPTEAAAAVKTRFVNVNRNEWDHAIKEDNQIVGYTTWQNEEGQTMIVPGFPSAVDGLYHIEENVPTGRHIDNEWGGYDEYVPKNMAYTEAELIQKGQDSYLPVGDVTDEEIQYVSEWFRTHQYPDSEVPEFTEFFIQDISQDYDRVSYPNGAAIDRELTVYTGGSLAEDGYWFEGGTPDNGHDPIVFGMDFFAVKTTEADWEHENNFNAQKTNKLDGVNPDNSTEFPNRTLKYWTTNGGHTTSFMYHNSDDSQNYENYVLVHLSFDGPRTGLHYDGYYLAFDYQFRDLMETKTEGGVTTYKYAQRKPDGYYSNWIVKLAPADPDWNEPAKKWYRVMCEDLGNSYDFDFNDIVFDVSYEGTAGNYTATVRLQAAGGTLPIYIGAFAPANEAHYMLSRGDAPKRNDGTYKPINVSEGGMQFAEYQPYEFTLQTATNNPDDIDIYVSNVGNKGTRVVKLPKSGTVTKAPMKICIPDVTTRWMRESMQIEETYTYFKYWVQNETSEYNFGQSKAWNKNGIEKAERLW